MEVGVGAIVLGASVLALLALMWMWRATAPRKVVLRQPEWNWAQSRPPSSTYSLGGSGSRTMPFPQRWWISPPAALDQIGPDGRTLRQTLSANHAQIAQLQSDPRVANSPVRGYLDALVSGGGLLGGVAAGTTPTPPPPPPPG